MRHPHKESSTLEFKRHLPEKKLSIIKTVVAFSNTYGEQVVIGVDDNGHISGIDEEHIEQMCDDLTRSIYASVAPSIFPSIYTKQIESRLTIVIDIPEGTNKPYHLNSKELDNSTYVRLGAHTMLATADIIHQLQWQGQRQRKFLDEMPVYEASENDIDSDLFNQFLAKSRQKNTDIDTINMLYHYEILVKDRGRVYSTVGGLLLFGKNIQKFFPEAFIICSHFSGVSGRGALATRDSTGNLMRQHKDTIAFILSRLNTSYEIVGAGRRDGQL